jgi:SpoVK/Ycf46/Vps4 family AAA+-type ATPase
MQTLTQFLKRLARWLGLGADTEASLSDLARKVAPQVGLEDLTLTESQAIALKETLSGARVARAGATLLLFSGGGTGKAKAAEALAKDLSRNLYRVNLGNVVSKYIGETEKNLQRLFRAAESDAAVLFFDEADAIFGKRSEVKDSHDRYATIEINYLLQRLENYEGLAILATDRENVTDILRCRIQFVVNFPHACQ